jgi:hypothetical protein
MFVPIEAPEWGDEIFTLQRGFDKAKAGDIFVRLNGKTERATPTDVRRLTARAKRADLRLNVSVDWHRPPHLRAVAMTPEQVSAWADRELERLRPREQARLSAYDVTAMMTRETRTATSSRTRFANTRRRCPRATGCWRANGPSTRARPRWP